MGSWPPSLSTFAQDLRGGGIPVEQGGRSTGRCCAVAAGCSHLETRAPHGAADVDLCYVHRDGFTIQTIR